MNLLGAGNPLSAVEGKKRVAVIDHRPPLTSPVTLVVMLLKGCGFAWYGARKVTADGGEATTCYIDTLTKYSDGTEQRRVVWTFSADDTVEIASERVGIHAVAHAFGYSQFSGAPLPGGAREVIESVRDVAPLTPDPIPFNERGRRLLAAAAACRTREGREWLANTVELYRGFCWKLSTPANHPPHPEYGYPLDRHLRYRRGKRTGDVRQSIPYDQRMEELRQLGLR